MYERNRKLLPDRLFPFSLPSIHRIFRTQPFACTAGTFSFRAKRFVEICSSLQAIRTFCYGNLDDETSTDTSHTGRKRERERLQKAQRRGYLHFSRAVPVRSFVPPLSTNRPARFTRAIRGQPILSSISTDLEISYFSWTDACIFVLFFFFFYDSWVLRTLHGRFVKRKIISSTELFSKV